MYYLRFILFLISIVLGFIAARIVIPRERVEEKNRVFLLIYLLSVFALFYSIVTHTPFFILISILLMITNILFFFYRKVILYLITLFLIFFFIFDNYLFWISLTLPFVQSFSIYIFRKN